MMKTAEQIRRENLARLAEECGGVGKLAVMLDRAPAQVSQWLNASRDSKTGKPRAVSSASARYIEARCGKPKGWLDHEHPRGRPEGLRFPYTWSNRNAPDDALIANALLHPIFEDLVRLQLHYGAEALGRVFDRLVEEGLLEGPYRREIARMLHNIHTGVERYRAGCH